jgi:hypothetical protein
VAGVYEGLLEPGADMVKMGDGEEDAGSPVDVPLAQLVEGGLEKRKFTVYPGVPPVQEAWKEMSPLPWP